MEILELWNWAFYLFSLISFIFEGGKKSICLFSKPWLLEKKQVYISNLLLIFILISKYILHFCKRTHICVQWSNTFLYICKYVYVFMFVYLCCIYYCLYYLDSLWFIVFQTSSLPLLHLIFYPCLNLLQNVFFLVIQYVKSYNHTYDHLFFVTS